MGKGVQGGWLTRTRSSGGIIIVLCGMGVNVVIVGGMRGWWALLKKERVLVAGIVWPWLVCVVHVKGYEKRECEQYSEYIRNDKRHILFSRCSPNLVTGAMLSTIFPVYIQARAPNQQSSSASKSNLCR